ncbi:MAG: ATP-binding cassette domain-containing protein [Planctomycetota bacterium]
MKTYLGGTVAIDDISIDIEPGLFGLLGPNGAGKSTLMRTLATLQLPDSGSVSLDGIDFLKSPRSARSLLGYLPQDMGVYPRVTARELLDYMASLKGLGSLKLRSELVNERLEKVNLISVADQRLETYSGGMRKRFGIAAALLGNPKLVIVDEPTAGLDPAERRRFQLLLTESAKDCVLILSSHIVEDIAGLCQQMAIMKSGRFIKVGSPNELISQLDRGVFEQSVSFNEFEEIQNQGPVLSWKPSVDSICVRVLDSEYVDKTTWQQVEPTLEDVYAHCVQGQS